MSQTVSLGRLPGARTDGLPDHMPPATRPPTNPHRPGFVARTALALASLSLLVLSLVVPIAPAGATTAPSTLALVSQTPTVTSTAGMEMTVAISSLLPARRLGLEVTLYSQATERGYFEQSVRGDLAGFVPLVQAPVIPLSAGGLLTASGTASIHLPVSAPSLTGPRPKTPRNGAVLTIPCGTQCPGVYPLQVTLEDTKDAIPLASFVTYLVLTPTSVSSPLHFSLVIPVGTSPAYEGDGRPAIDPADEAELGLLARSLAAHPSVDCSLVVSPQLAGALQEKSGGKGPAAVAARRALSSLKRLVGLGNVELEADTYAPVDVASLTASHLQREIGPQLSLGRRLLRGLGAVVDPHRFVSQWPIGLGAAQALSSRGVEQLVVPSSSVAPFQPSRWEYPVWAPFIIRHARRDTVVADASDASLESHLESGSDPVLRADQLLADLAILYFVEQPPEPRGVSLLAPPGWRPSGRFLTTLLDGLAAGDLVKTDTLSSFFTEVPPGSAEQPLLVRSLASPTIASAQRLAAGRLGTARIKLQALNGLLPPTSFAVRSLEERVLLGESAVLSPSRRRVYLGAPGRALRREATRITLPVGKTITITSLSAKVPISIYSTSHYPLHVRVFLESTDLSFHTHELDLTLHQKNNTREVALSARTAGDFPFMLSVRTRRGDFLLARGKVLIRSTAISGVAVGLTAGAGAFLLAWWGQSALRKRRGRHAKSRRGGVAEEASPVSAP